MTHPPAKRPLWVKALRLLGFVTGTYLLVLVVMKCFETTLVHMPGGADDWSGPPTDRVQDVTVTAADGNVIHMWWLPPPDGSPRRAVLYCHGNGGNLSHRGPLLADFQRQLGCGVLVFDYPGYGKSTGWPTEPACHAATAAAFGWLTGAGRYAPSDVVLFGESMGGGVATDLATRCSARGLVLCCTYTSVPDAAAHRYPWLPCHLVMSARFDSRSKLPGVSCPVLVIHGTADRTIPFWQGEALFSAANAPKRLVRQEGAGHCQWCTEEAWQAVRELVTSP